MKSFKIPLLVLLIFLLFLFTSCGAEPTPTPDAVATQIAVEKAAHATMTAEAPTATNTPTDTATPTSTNTPTSTPTDTPSPSPTETWTPSPTPPHTPTMTPSMTPTSTATQKPKPKPTNAPQARKMLLFVSNEASDNDLFFVDTKGDNRRRLTKLGRISNAKYSPDGQRIAFSRQESEKPNNYDIYVMNADGSNVVNITQTQDWVEFDPDWSPDGTKIVFRGRPEVDAFSKVYIVNADGSGRALLTDVNQSSRSPSWAPDGSRIAFVSYWEGSGGGYWQDKGDIFVINTDGSGLANLTNRGEHFAEPVWSPDGNELIYGRLPRDPSTGEYWQIWRMNTDGGNQRCIIGCFGTFSQFSNVPVAWRGSRIAFRGWEGGDWDVFIANDDGTGIVQITSQSADESTLDWQP